MTDSSGHVTAAMVWRIISEKRTLLIVLPLSLAVLGAVGSFFLPDVYKGEVLLAPALTSDHEDTRLQNSVSLGGLASMAGISIAPQRTVDENLAVLQSCKFIWEFVSELDLLPVLFADQWDAEKEQWNIADTTDAPTLWDAYRLLLQEGVLNVYVEQDKGLIHVSVLWTDAALASEWANELVRRLNDYLRNVAIERSQVNLRYLNDELGRSQINEMRQTLYDLIAQEQRSAMLANTQSEYAFRVIDPSVVEDRKVKPRRRVIVYLSFLLGLIGGGCIVFFSVVRQSLKPES